MQMLVALLVGSHYTYYFTAYEAKELQKVIWRFREGHLSIREVSFMSSYEAKSSRPLGTHDLYN